MKIQIHNVGRFVLDVVARYRSQFPISEPDVVAIRKSNG